MRSVAAPADPSKQAFRTPRPEFTTKLPGLSDSSCTDWASWRGIAWGFDYGIVLRKTERLRDALVPVLRVANLPVPQGTRQLNFSWCGKNAIRSPAATTSREPVLNKGYWRPVAVMCKGVAAGLL